MKDSEVYGDNTSDQSVHKYFVHKYYWTHNWLLQCNISNNDGYYAVKTTF